jgi:hypothetical protein
MSIRSYFLVTLILFSALAYAETPEAKQDWKLPTVEYRDRTIKKAGLDSKVGDWGSAEKDQLYSVARDSSLEDLVKKYPSLPRSRLKVLSKLAKTGAKSKSPTAEGQPKANPDDVIDKVVHLGP